MPTPLGPGSGSLDCTTIRFGSGAGTVHDSETGYVAGGGYVVSDEFLFWYATDDLAMANAYLIYVSSLVLLQTFHPIKFFRV